MCPTTKAYSLWKCLQVEYMQIEKVLTGTYNVVLHIYDQLTVLLCAAYLPVPLDSGNLWFGQLQDSIVVH